MSIIEKIDLFAASLPRTCLYCRNGFPIAWGTESMLEVIACGAHFLDTPKTKKATLRITRPNPRRQENKGRVLYAPLLNADEGCADWAPVEFCGRKFRLLDALGAFGEAGGPS